YTNSAFTGSRLSAVVGREVLLTATTLGSAQLARAGSAAARYIYQGLQLFNVTRAGYEVGEGGSRVYNGELGGVGEVIGGVLGVAGSFSLAATYRELNGLFGGSSESWGPIGRLVNWWNLGAEADDAYRKSSLMEKILTEHGQSAQPTSVFT